MGVATVSVNVPERMKERLRELAEEGMYQNTSEYVRDALREKIESDSGLISEEEAVVERRLEAMEGRDGDGRKSLEEVREESS